MLEIDYKAIGNRVKNRRLEKNLTQEELGEKVGISGKHIGTIERGEGMPGMETFIKIVNVLETSSDKILADNIVNSKIIYNKEVKELLEDLDHDELKLIIEMIKYNKDSIRKAALSERKKSKK